jgi:hypothetical protein
VKPSDAVTIVLAVLVAALFLHAVTVWIRTRQRKDRTALTVAQPAAAEPQASAAPEPESLRPAPGPAVDPTPIAQSA